jgi:hypothetical protein
MSEPTGLQSFNDPGQNRESGGKASEQTPYAASENGEDGNAETGGQG